MAMARKETDHPDYHFIKVIMTNGTEYTTRSTYGKEGDTLNLDIDPSTHPAWTRSEERRVGSDWSSDVCSSDLLHQSDHDQRHRVHHSLDLRQRGRHPQPRH